MAGVGGLVVLALSAFLYFRFTDAGSTAGPIPLDSTAATQSPVGDPASAPGFPRDSVLDTALMGGLPLTPDTLPEPDVVSVATPSAPVVAPPPLAPPAAAVWVQATALTYINVRSAADRKAPVVGVVTPDMKVELGARHLGWRQVRAPGVNGWADPRNFAVAGVAPPR